MTAEEFERLAADIGFSPVPERFRALISNVALCVEDDVSDETRKDMELPDEDTLLGLYRGIPLTARGDHYGSALPDTITLYRLPIVQAAEEDGISIRQVIEETVWHEVAHHFGLDEDDVRKREEEIRNSFKK